MSSIPFDLIQPNQRGPLKDRSLLTKRPVVEMDRSFKADAKRFVPGERLAIAMNTAIALGEPLLITGEPGTGKTQAAYYAAYKLGLDEVIHFQVKSDSTAHDLLYHFDTIRYFHDAHLLNLEQNNSAETADAQAKKTIDKKTYVEPRALWEAFDKAEEKEVPQILLIDEIDKAPRDFPNDLLHELDQMEFTVTETGEKVATSRAFRPLVFITSNSERRLPEPFLRRCVYHHIEFNDIIVKEAIKARKDEFGNLSQDFLKLAMIRFLALRDRPLRKKPATGELLMWLRILSLTVGVDEEQLDENLSKLPYLGVLLKDHQDMKEVTGT